MIDLMVNHNLDDIKDGNGKLVTKRSKTVYSDGDRESFLYIFRGGKSGGADESIGLKVDSRNLTFYFWTESELVEELDTLHLDNVVYGEDASKKRIMLTADLVTPSGVSIPVEIDHRDYLPADAAPGTEPYKLKYIVAG